MAPVAPLTAGYRSAPYWWDGVDLHRPPEAAPPPTADVVVVGGGYTGLGAALELARRGRHVVVLERHGIGGGASGRNGGMAHPGGSPGITDFLGLPDGRRLWEDTVAALESLASLCGELAIDCDWQRCGHIELAHHPRALDRLRAEADGHRSVGEDARFLGRDELAAEIGSTAFHGGLVVTRSAAVHPAKLVTGLARAAAAAGAELHERCGVDALHVLGAVGAGGPGGGASRGYVVTGPWGSVRCRQVVMATNGDTDGRLVPWLGPRVLGIGSFVIATEPLAPGVAESVSPRGRTFFDTRNLLHYWRLSPDGHRVLFGGRASLSPTTVERARDLLYRAMVGIHPQLAGVEVERAWGGQVAFTADRLPHVGRDPRSGVVHAMGYCGSGVAQAVHLGRAVGRWLAGDGELPVLARRPWPPVPWPARVRGLLPVAGWWFRARDALGR